MEHCDTLISAGWIIPVEPAGIVLNDHSVAVTDGRIVDLLPTPVALERFSAMEQVRRPGHVLIPGLVNTHCHAAMVLLRGFAEDLPLEVWLEKSIWPAEGRWVGPEFVRDGTRLAIAEMLLAGCTCFSDQYFFPEIVAETSAEAHMRAVVGTPVVDFPNAWAQSAVECLEKAADLVHDAYADHPLISTCFAPHSVVSVSDAAFADLRVMADQLDRSVQIHLHESADEVRRSVSATGRRPIDRLRNLGLLNSSLLAVHAVHVTDDEIAAIAEAGVAVAHCARSNLKLADGIAPLGKLLRAGIGVGFGTDGAASNNMLDMFDEMRTATQLAKAVSGDASSLPAVDALRLATLGGAEVLGLEASTGSLQFGKWADMTCVNLLHLNSQPVYDPVAQLVHAVRANQVSDVWVAGRQQVADGRLVQIDEAQVLARTREWAVRIASGAGVS